MTDFELDARLQHDTVLIGDWSLSRILLMNDRHYPWLILVPRRAGISEIYQLDDADRAQLLSESCLLAQSMAEVLKPQKMNVANLGNVVAQLHVHHVARFVDDPAWPAPIWGKLPPHKYADEVLLETQLFWQALLAQKQPFMSAPGL